MKRESSHSPAEGSAPGLAGRRPVRRFLAIFLATVAAFYGLTLSPWMDAHVLYPVMEASARGTSLVLGVFGVRTAVDGVVVRGADYAMAVRRGCDPLEPMVLFGAGVAAFPSPWMRKLAGLAAGEAVLFGMNLARLVTLYVLGARRSAWFASFHLDWWPAFFLIFALALWAGWMSWSGAGPSGADRAKARRGQARTGEP
jgi:exosortase H (IPTLxxWG-CTERM-specific)